MQADQERALNLMTWNISGLTHPIKKKKKMFIKSKRFDIVFLQETCLLARASRKLCRDWMSHVSGLCDSSRSKGVVILTHKQFQFKGIRENGDGGKIQCYEVIYFMTLRGGKLLLVGAFNGVLLNKICLPQI